MNKEKYIKKVIRLLNCSQQQKKKIKMVNHLKKSFKEWGHQKNWLMNLMKTWV